MYMHCSDVFFTVFIVELCLCIWWIHVVANGGFVHWLFFYQLFFYPHFHSLHFFPPFPRFLFSLSLPLPPLSPPQLISDYSVSGSRHMSLLIPSLINSLAIINNTGYSLRAKAQVRLNIIISFFIAFFH